MGGSAGRLSPTHYAADRVFHIQGFLPAKTGSPVLLMRLLTHHQPILTYFHLRHAKLRPAASGQEKFLRFCFKKRERI